MGESGVQWWTVGPGKRQVVPRWGTRGGEGRCSSALTRLASTRRAACSCPPSTARSCPGAGAHQGAGALPVRVPAVRVRPHHRGPAHRAGDAKAVRDYSRVFFASASDETPDRQGRVTIPPALREYAGLQRDCVVIGANTRLEIWDAAGLDQLPGPAGRRVLRRIGGGAARSSVTGRVPTRPPVPGEVSTRGWTARPADATSPAPGGTTAVRASARMGAWPGITSAERDRQPNTCCERTFAVHEQLTDERQGGGPMSAADAARPATCRSCGTGSSRCSAPRWSPTARSWWTPPWAGPGTPAPCWPPTPA